MVNSCGELKILKEKATLSYFSSAGSSPKVVYLAFWHFPVYGLLIWLAACSFDSGYKFQCNLPNCVQVLNMASTMRLSWCEGGRMQGAWVRCYLVAINLVDEPINRMIASFQFERTKLIVCCGNGDACSSEMSPCTVHSNAKKIFEIWPG